MLSTMSGQRYGLRFPESVENTRRELEFFERFLGGDAGLFVHGEWCAPVALWEDNEHIYFEMDVPGVAIDNLEMTIHQGNLRVFVDRTMPEEKREYWFNERRYGRIDRIIPLPEAVDADSIDAELHEGVLHVVLTKKPEAYSKKIVVRSNGKDRS